MKQRIIFRATFGVMLGALVLMGAWKEAEDKVEGQVEVVDSDSGMLTLAHGERLAVDLATPVRKDGRMASLSDIREGDHVQASFSPTLAWLFGQKGSLQDRVKQVVATSHSRETGSM